MNEVFIKKELIELIRDIFMYNGFDLESIERVNLINDLGMDSITFISLIVEIEMKFDITVPDNLLKIDNFQSVDDIFEKILFLNGK